MEKISKENEPEYYHQLSILKPSNNYLKEESIKKQLNKKYNGETEVFTEMGYIDLLTDDKLIEIKEYSKWKNTSGQLMAYSFEYPDSLKIMYLFNVGDQKTKYIKKICKKYNIKLKIFD